MSAALRHVKVPLHSTEQLNHELAFLAIGACLGFADL